MNEGKIEKLVRMANQIGDFFAPMPSNDAARGVANHLEKFWTPKMIGEIVSHARAGGSGLNPTAARAVESLGRDTRFENRSRGIV